MYFCKIFVNFKNLFPNLSNFAKDIKIRLNLNLDGKNASVFWEKNDWKSLEEDSSKKNDWQKTTGKVAEASAAADILAQ